MQFIPIHLVIIAYIVLKISGVRFGRDKKKVFIEHYCKKDKESLSRLRMELEEVWDIGLSYETLWGRLEEVQDRLLKKERKRRIGEKGGDRIVECEWVTEEIRKAIDKRRELNRKKRHSVGEEKDKWEREWKAQKIKVQRLVKESKEKWGQEQAREVWTCKNRGKQLWKHINKLKQKGKQRGI